MELNRTLVPIGIRIYEDQEREINELAEEYGVKKHQMHREILDRGLHALKTGIKKAEYSIGDTISVQDGESSEKFRIETGKVLTKVKK